MTYLFVHIPKTAGTSLRISMEKSLGASSACYDYGSSSSETSECVMNFVHENKDLHSFYSCFTEQGCKFLAGHFAATKYLKYFQLKNSFALVRDPLQRVASEYLHFKTHYGFDGTFKDFYTDPRFVNRQIKLLGEVTWPLLGFVGLSEKYRESVSLINNYFNWNLDYFELNKHAQDVGVNHDVSDEEIEAITNLNAKDIKLYDTVSKQFSMRLYAMDQQQPFFTGMVSGFASNVLKGWVIPNTEDSFVEVDVAVNGAFVARVKAVDYLPLLGQYNSRRCGYVAFNCKLNGLSISDVVEANVAQTGQPLINSPLIITQEHLTGP